MNIRLYECKVSDKVKIIGGLGMLCQDASGKEGIILSNDVYRLLISKGIEELGDMNHLYPNTIHVMSDGRIYTVNRDCYVELIQTTNNEKAKDEVKEKENIMKDFRIKDYKVYENKTVILEFKDGTKEKAVCNEGDSFDLERGVELCVLKHLLGVDGYKAIVKTAMKQIKAVDQVKEDKKKEEELIQRRKAKADRRKVRRLEKKREARINEMKEAYVRAIKETGSVCDVPCADTLDDLK